MSYSIHNVNSNLTSYENLLDESHCVNKNFNDDLNLNKNTCMLNQTMNNTKNINNSHVKKPIEYKIVEDYDYTIPQGQNYNSSTDIEEYIYFRNDNKNPVIKNLNTLHVKKPIEYKIIEDYTIPQGHTHNSSKDIEEYIYFRNENKKL